MRLASIPTVFAALLFAGCGSPPASAPIALVAHEISPGADAEEKAQLAFNSVKPGESIHFAAGRYSFSQPLTLTVDGVRVFGDGMEKTVLSFKGQKTGSQGLFAQEANRIVIEDLTVADAAKDCVKVLGADGVVIRNVKAIWTEGEKETNGAYGLYPVQCKNVLVEGCVAIASADAGIYVGQSINVIVRHCRVERNVGGLEVENSTDVDVHDNVASDNTSGVLILDLPDLPGAPKKIYGKNIRVFRNKLLTNNHPNFAPKGGAIVSIMPPGCGVIVMGIDNVEVFDNEFVDNENSPVAVIAYQSTGRAYNDPEYDGISEGVIVANNRFKGGGGKPVGDLAQLLLPLIGKPFPDILYDGVLDPKKIKSPSDEDRYRLILDGNTREDGKPATFVNARIGTWDPKNASSAKFDRDPKNYKGSRPRLREVVVKEIASTASEGRANQRSAP